MTRTIYYLDRIRLARERGVSANLFVALQHLHAPDPIAQADLVRIVGDALVGRCTVRVELGN